MNTMTNNGTRTYGKMLRKFSFLADEAVWQFALVGIVTVAVVDRVMSLGGASIIA